MAACSMLKITKGLDKRLRSGEHYAMTKRKFVPTVEEMPPPSPAIRGRGASWSPANRFEKLHVDLGDIDVVQTDPDDGWPSLGAASRGEARKPTRRETQFFRDGTKTIITHNNSPDV